jgi:hypothetical protein
VPSSRSLARIRSIAGSVAPIAAVAGRSNRKIPEKATNQCHAGLGFAPMACSSQVVTGAKKNASARLQSAITASAAAYHRPGERLRSMRGPRINAPAASPPKKPAVTAKTAADSCPSHNALC